MKDVYADLKQIELIANEAMKKIQNEQSSESRFPLDSVSRKAYHNRLNAVLFSGRMNEEQRNCISLFSYSLVLMRLLGREVYYQYLAYMLATVYHETAFTMESIAEYGKGEGRPYGEPDERTGQSYYGRSYPQLTWYENYKKASDNLFDKKLSQGCIDFINEPDLILKPFYGMQVTVFGMLEGWFTGKSLDDFWGENGSYDYVNARKIINGTDKAHTIAGYAKEIESAILLASGQKIERAVLRVGDRGDDVTELQLALDIYADGFFGTNETEKALKEFQSNNDLNDDGICGAATWSKIDEVVYGIA